MNQMTPMYCQSCTNLNRAATKALDYCKQHKQPAFHIANHCIEVGGKSEQPIFFQKKVR